MGPTQKTRRRSFTSRSVSTRAHPRRYRSPDRQGAISPVPSGESQNPRLQAAVLTCAARDSGNLFVVIANTLGLADPNSQRFLDRLATVVGVQPPPAEAHAAT